MNEMEKKTVIIIFLLAVTYLHYVTEPRHHIMHVIHREMFLIPIILAAYWYGKKAGLVVAIVSTLLFLPQVFMNESISNPYVFNTLLELLTFYLVAYLLGSYQDIRKHGYIRDWQSISPPEGLSESGHDILVCIDNPQTSAKVISYVINNLAKHENMSITIMGLIRKPDRKLFTRQEEYETEEANSEKRISALIEDGRDRLSAAGFPAGKIYLKVSKVSGIATIASRILAEQENFDYDSIISGGIKMSKTEEFILGNTAVTLVRQADCPVAVVH